MPVAEGDTIFVLIADLEKAKEEPIVVKWTKGLSTAMSETYIKTFFTITKTHDGTGPTGSETRGVIFVQLSMLDEFKNKKVAEEPETTIVVNKTFVYGQKSKDGTGRWLVYHDQNNKPFQHRFISAAIAGAVEKAVELSKVLGFDTGESLLKDVGRFLGDLLHSF